MQKYNIATLLLIILILCVNLGYNFSLRNTVLELVDGIHQDSSMPIPKKKRRNFPYYIQMPNTKHELKCLVFIAEVQKLQECNFRKPFNPVKSDFLSICSIRDSTMEITTARNIVESKLCTHVYMGDFIEHSPKGLPQERAKPSKALEDLATFRAANIPVLARIGSHLSSSKMTQPLQLSQLASRNSSRFKFVAKALEIVTTRGFQGIFIYWFYPGCPSLMCIGNSEDKQNFVLLSEEFQRQFAPKGLLVAANVPPLQEFIKKGIDIEPLSKALDLILVTNTEFNLFSKISFVSSLADVNVYLKQIINKVENPRKVLAAVRNSYFNYLKVKPENYHVFNSPGIKGNILGIPFTQVCKWIRHDNFSVVRNHEKQNYAFRKGNWFSFDDEILVQKKVEMWQEMGLGGVWITDIEWDDPQNECGCGHFPNTKSFMVGLRGDHYCKLPRCL